MLRMLLEHGACPDGEHAGLALVEAASRPCQEALLILLRCGAAKRRQTLQLALRAAAASGAPAGVKALISFGAQPTCEIMRVAASHANRSVLSCLLASGGRPCMCSIQAANAASQFWAAAMLLSASDQK